MLRNKYFQVRKTPSWPRSLANFSLLQLYSHGNAWAGLHLLGQPNTFLASAVPLDGEGAGRGREGGGAAAAAGRRPAALRALSAPPAAWRWPLHRHCRRRSGTAAARSHYVFLKFPLLLAVCTALLCLLYILPSSVYCVCSICSLLTRAAATGLGGVLGGGLRLRALPPSEKDAVSAQKLGQLQPFLPVFPWECVGQLAYFGPT